MIAEREEQIHKFQPKPYYGAAAKCSSPSILFTWQDGEKGSSHSFDREKLQNIVDRCSGEAARIIEVRRAPKKTGAPLLYDLNELQRDANRRFGFSAKETLDIMQRLYENHKVLTYPRTDSRYLPTEDVYKRQVLENGNVVFINELCYNFLEPARLDVVLFESADDESRTFVKRIIGLPGETVQIVDGAVLIDGEAASLPDGLDLAAIPGLAKDPVTLEENEYFMLGDNRDSSEDSRFVNVGKVNRSQIVGKIWLRVSPLSELEMCIRDSLSARQMNIW